ncbi:helix-turn-helix transcriptional regulator [Picosynechococcus sp. NKBG15041c]|uniref:helix-turn-helix transcriptional regulator n=1 Tax=Picosynechococcus sp. NKBG15041c TaxID=1407650 RepID=UPI0004671C47|nr:helix-turn-helix transcriptional regulator [Picosynechococcus sp. NKBG15041c]
MMSVKECNKLTLKTLRKLLGMNQAEFAQALGLERRQTVSEWERGKARPSLSVSQVKALDNLLDTVGLRLKDLPDDVSQ